MEAGIAVADQGFIFNNVDQGFICNNVGTRLLVSFLVHCQRLLSTKFPRSLQFQGRGEEGAEACPSRELCEIAGSPTSTSSVPPSYFIETLGTSFL